MSSIMSVNPARPPVVTATEAEIVRLLGEAWNLYAGLPQEHPMAQSEFCSAIHRCQDMVLARCGQRQLAGRELRLGGYQPQVGPAEDAQAIPPSER